jgi:hypothetical protein
MMLRISGTKVKENPGYYIGFVPCRPKMHCYFEVCKRLRQTWPITYLQACPIGTGSFQNFMCLLLAFSSKQVIEENLVEMHDLCEGLIFRGVILPRPELEMLM